MYYQRTLVFNNSWYNLYSSFGRLFPKQFLSILFSGSKRMKTEKPGKHEEIKGFKLGG